MGRSSRPVPGLARKRLTTLRSFLPAIRCSRDVRVGRVARRGVGRTRAAAISSRALARASSTLRDCVRVSWLGRGDLADRAVASMVARDWRDTQIHERIEFARKEACVRAHMEYDWPGSSRAKF